MTITFQELLGESLKTPLQFQYTQDTRIPSAFYSVATTSAGNEYGFSLEETKFKGVYEASAYRVSGNKKFLWKFHGAQDIRQVVSTLIYFVTSTQSMIQEKGRTKGLIIKLPLNLQNSQKYIGLLRRILRQSPMHTQYKVVEFKNKPAPHNRKYDPFYGSLLFLVRKEVSPDLLFTSKSFQRAYEFLVDEGLDAKQAQEVALGQSTTKLVSKKTVSRIRMSSDEFALKATQEKQKKTEELVAKGLVPTLEIDSVSSVESDILGKDMKTIEDNVAGMEIVQNVTNNMDVSAGFDEIKKKEEQELERQILFKSLANADAELAIGMVLAREFWPEKYGKMSSEELIEIAADGFDVGESMTIRTALKSSITVKKQVEEFSANLLSNPTYMKNLEDKHPKPEIEDDSKTKYKATRIKLPFKITTDFDAEDNPNNVNFEDTGYLNMRSESQWEEPYVDQYIKGGKYETMVRDEDANRNILDKVNPRYRQSLRAYTGASYRQINGMVRNFIAGQYTLADAIDDSKFSILNGSYPENIRRTYDAMGAFDHINKTKKSMWVYRKVNSKGQMPVYEAGQRYIDPGFLSTSIDASVWDGNVRMKIFVPEGSTIYPAITSGASSNSGEKEVIFPPGTILKIIEVHVSDEAKENLETGYNASDEDTSHYTNETDYIYYVAIYMGSVYKGIREKFKQEILDPLSEKFDAPQEIPFGEKLPKFSEWLTEQKENVKNNGAGGEEKASAHTQKQEQAVKDLIDKGFVVTK
jgi:hypothetical protein